MHNMRRNKLAKVFIILIMVIFAINSTSALAVAMELYNGYQAEKQWQAILNAELNEAAPSLGDTADQKIEQPEVVAPIEQDSTYSLEKEESEPVDLGAVLAENEFDSTNPQAVDSPAGPAEQDWQDKGALPFNLKDFKTAESNGRLYVFGGLDTAGQVVNSVYEYDPVANNWAAKASMPIYAQGFAVASAYGKIYLIGGLSSATQNGAYNWTTTAYEFDPMANTWQQKAPMSQVRWDLEASFYQGKIYAIGGLDTNWAASNVVEAYDPLTNTWVAIGGMPQYIGTPYSFVSNNKLYVFDRSAPLRDAAIVFYIYDSISWQSSTSQGLCSANAFINLNDTLYAIGYLGSSGSTQNIYRYSIQENMWGFYSAPGNSFGRINVVTILNSEVYIFTGTSDYCTKLVKYTTKTSPWMRKNSLQGLVVSPGTITYYGTTGAAVIGDNIHFPSKTYNIKTDTWQDKANINNSSISDVAIETLSGKLYAICGWLYDNPAKGCPVEEYDPGTNKWTNKTSIPEELFTVSDYYNSSIGSGPKDRTLSLGPVSLPATTAYNGKIYVLGGFASACEFKLYTSPLSPLSRNYPSAAVSTARYYIPNSGWSTVQSMPTAVYAAGAAILKDKIYVAGGIPNVSLDSNDSYYYRKITIGYKPTNTLQIYNPANNSWVTKTMPIAIAHAGITAGPDSIYIVGGITSDNKVSDLVYEYNPTLDKWFTWQGPDYSRRNLTLVAANNGLYAIGGYNGNTIIGIMEFVPFSDLSLGNEYLHMGEEDWIDPTGNFSRTFVDMSYTAPGFNVNISRTYNSQDYRPSLFCTGWTFGFQGKVSDEGNNMMVRLPDGSGHSFKPESNGTYTAKDSHSILVKNGDNTYTLTTADQYKYGFNSGGYLTYMEDKNGNRITITVDANGKISRVTDPVGGIITVNYDGLNRISSIFDPVGRAVIYTYGTGISYSYQTLNKVTDPGGNSTNYSYTYMRPNTNYEWINYLSEVRDNANALLEKMEYTPITLEKPLPMLTAITDANGKREAYTYNSDAGTVAITDNGGRTTTIWYDKMLYPIRTRDAEGGDSLTEYGLGGGANRFGEVKRQTDRNGNSTNYDWDSHGNVTCVVNPDGSYQKYTYDAKNNLLSEKDALGGATYYVYDASGNLAKKARRLSGTEDYSDWADQSNFAITVYSYGYRGLLYWEMDPERVTTEYIYDNYGNLSASRKYTSDVTYNATTYQYNRLGWLMWEKTPSGQQTSYYYDKNGRLLKKILPDGGTERYVYDAMGNLSQKITPNQYASGFDSATFDGMNILNNGGAYTQTDHGYRYQYTPSGLVTQEIDPLNYVTQYGFYDIYGNKRMETKANGAIHTYFYDKLDRLYAMEYAPSASDSHVTTETYSYGISGGKTITTATKYLTSSTTAVTTTTYDYVGRMVKQVNPDGGVIEKTYNANGTLQQSKDALGNITSYQYDALGRLIKQWTPAEGGKYSYLGLKYDKSDRVTYQYRGVDLVASGTDAVDLVWSRNEYDRDGTITRKSNSQGGRTDYTYDTDGHLTQEKQYTTDTAYNQIDYTYDTMGRISSKRLAANKEDIDPVRLSRVFLLDESYYLTITENNFPNKISYIPASSDPQLHIRTEEIRESEVVLTLKITANEDSAGQIFWRTLDSMHTEEKSKWFNVRSGTHEYTIDLGAISLDNIRIDVGVPDSMVTICDIQMKFESDLTTGYAYDKQGNMLTQVDANGITATYTYDLLNRQLSASQPGKNENGELENISNYKTYDWAGNVLTESDPLGGTISYTYDARGLLTMVNNPLGGITAYEYDLAGRKIKEISPQNYAANQANRTEFAYDSMGRLTKQTDYFNDSSISNSFSYDKNGNLLSKTDGMGYVTGYTYSESNQPATVLDPVSADRGLEFSSKSEYDGLGRKIKETNAEGMVSQYSYDDLGNLLSTKLSDRTLETNTYDFLGNLLTKKDANGNTTTFTYNALNQVKQATLPSDDNIPSYSITYKYDKLGRQVEALESMGKKTATSYDNQGRQLSQTESKNDGSQAITVSKRYDKNGNLRFLVDGNGNETEYVYDALNRKIQDKAKVTVNGELTTKATSYDYDANGNIISATDWLGNKAENIYDPLNRLIQRKDASGTVIETLTYNANHQQTKSTDALGYDTDFAYNKNNQLLKKTTYLDADHPIVEQQTYDNLGRVAGKIDGRGNTTRYSYNDYGNLEWVKDALDNYTYFEYDFNGNLLSQSNMTGHQTQFAYNARNLPQSKTDALGHDEIYNYYAGGALSSKIDRNGVQSGYTYDIHDRLLLEYKGGVSIWHSYDNNSNELTLTDSTGITTRDYDELNRVISKTVPDIGMTVFTYDETGGLTAGFHRETTTDPHGNITKKVMDKNGRLSQVLDGNSPVATYTYLDNGNREKVSYASGVVEEYTYNENNQIKTLANKNAAGSTIEAFNYGYDAAGNMVNKLDKKGITSYAYDENNRLASVNEPDGKVTDYTFDQAGNRATETAKIDSDTTITSYSYDENNRLVQTEKEENGKAIGSDDYTYDPNGNMIARISLSGNEENTGSDTFLSIVGEDEDSSDVTLYSYDVYNNLTEVLEGANRVEMKYNGAGQRVEKFTNNSTTRYLYEYDKVILEQDENGEQTGRNIYGLNLLRRQESEASLDYLYNGHGDVTNLMKSATIAASYYYDAFGNITEDDNSYSNPYRYAGYQWDADSKLYYINSRHYNPTLARFLQEDTYRGTAGDPLSLNLYTYCHNNPIQYFDPTGHFESKDVNNVAKAKENHLKALETGDLKQIQATYDKWEDAKRTSRLNSLALANTERVAAEKAAQAAKKDSMYIPIEMLMEYYGIPGFKSTNKVQWTVKTKNLRQCFSVELNNNKALCEILEKGKKADQQIDNKYFSGDSVDFLFFTGLMSSFGYDVNISKAARLIDSYYNTETKVRDNINNGGINIFAFEGLGNYKGTGIDDYHPKGRYGAMDIVMEGNNVVYVTRNASTLPSRPGEDCAVVQEGIYSLGAKMHHDEYSALRVLNLDGTDNIPAYYPGGQLSTTGHKQDRATTINIHTSPDESTVDWSTGCQLVMSTDYAKFAVAAGFIENNEAARAIESIPDYNSWYASGANGGLNKLKLLKPTFPESYDAKMNLKTIPNYIYVLDRSFMDITERAKWHTTK